MTRETRVEHKPESRANTNITFNVSRCLLSFYVTVSERAKKIQRVNVVNNCCYNTPRSTYCNILPIPHTEANFPYCFPAPRSVQHVRLLSAWYRSVYDIQAQFTNKSRRNHADKTSLKANPHRVPLSHNEYANLSKFLLHDTRYK